MTIITSLARGAGRVSGWTAATVVSAASKALDDAGEAGVVFTEAYEASYDARTAWCEMTPEQQAAHKAAERAAKRARIAAKREAPAAIPAPVPKAPKARKQPA
jgi:hypothetical protein